MALWRKPSVLRRLRCRVLGMVGSNGIAYTAARWRRANAQTARHHSSWHGARSVRRKKKKQSAYHGRGAWLSTARRGVFAASRGIVIVAVCMNSGSSRRGKHLRATSGNIAQHSGLRTDARGVLRDVVTSRLIASSINKASGGGIATCIV